MGSVPMWLRITPARCVGLSRPGALAGLTTLHFQSRSPAYFAAIKGDTDERTELFNRRMSGESVCAGRHPCYLQGSLSRLPHVEAATGPTDVS
jgi:hypothetical protein